MDTVFTATNRDAWQRIADEASEQRPSFGKTVEIVSGRKHKGKTGIVVKHQVDQYADTRYKTDASLALREINGREGYVVLVKANDGSLFWVKAEYTLVKT